MGGTSNARKQQMLDYVRKVDRAVTTKEISEQIPAMELEDIRETWRRLEAQGLVEMVAKAKTVKFYAITQLGRETLVVRSRKPWMLREARAEAEATKRSTEPTGATPG